MQPAGRLREHSHLDAPPASPGGTGRSAGHRPRLQSRAATRLATVGLALVLVSLAGFGLWAARSTSRATRQVVFVAGLYDAFEQARFALAAEESLERRYHLDPGPQARVELERAARSLREALAYVGQRGDAHDRSAIAVIGAQHDRYRDAVRQELAAVDAGQPGRAEALDRTSEPLFAAMEREVEQAAEREGEEALGALADLEMLARRVEVATPVVFAVGLVLLGVFWLLVVGLQRRTERQAADNQPQALHDGLTGLPNRTLLHDRIGQAIRQADRERVPAALLLLDLDRFKEVNDTLGHHYGDLLLVQVSQRLRGLLRAVDTVARLGGDEFAVLLPKIATAEGAVAVAKKLTAGLDEPFLLEGFSLDVEASIGVALYPEHANTSQELLQRADIAMYVAKDTHAGFVLFDPTQDQRSPRRLALLGELRRAIEDEQLLLHYQPKVDAHTGQVLGVEALVRWQHPTHGLVPPGEFIPLAERTGLITPLTHYVLDAALHQCRDWRRAGHELSVAVNVSARRLLDLEFPQEVAAALATWEVPARLLVVEITESTTMADPTHALEILGRLDEMGVQLAIDDFGTGYSSMAYLKSLPVHELKVDRSFVAQMTSNSSDAVIVHSTIDLGRNLGLRVVAEGVEDSLTLQHLDLLGCHAVQGYHTGKPMPADDLSQWLNQPHHPAPTPATRQAPPT
jgi:diguanylate cyclase